MYRIAFILVLFFFVNVSVADTITVAPDGSADFPTIQSAIDNAESGDIVILSPAIYTGDGNRNLSFQGKSITVRSSDPADPDIVAATIIDCQAAESNPHRAFTFQNAENPDAILDGITIINGFGPPIQVEGNWLSVGGAILCLDSSPTISRCRLENNSAHAGGGIACGFGGSPTISLCTIKNNTAHGNGGGGVISADSNPTITHCLITQNSSIGETGGGISCVGGNPVISHCTISENLALNENELGHDGDGAAISCDNSPAQILNCLILNNSAQSQAGGIYCLECKNEIQIHHCTFAGNSAQDSGISIYCDYSDMNLSHCILWDKLLDSGGLYYWAPVALTHDSDIKISNSCILDTGQSFFEGWGVAFLDIIGDCSADWDDENLKNDPLLRYDGHLKPDSPCIDAGKKTSSVTLDMDDEPRKFNTRIDLGADEFIDTDDDDLPDWWELLFFNSSTAAAPDDDPDNNQRDNLTEYLLSTDPLAPTPTYYVDPVLGNDACDGLSPTLDSIHGPKASIQNAIDTSQKEEGVIILAQGIYQGPGNRDIEFNGKWITVRSTDPNIPAVVNATIIDCQGDQNHPHRGFRFDHDENELSILSGVTITNGCAPHEIIDGPGFTEGGAILCLDSAPTISYCHLFGNIAGYPGGGALAIHNGSPNITHCLFQNNHVLDIGHDSGNGGAIVCLQSSQPTISHCSIIENTVTQWSGGAIACEQGTAVTLTDCIIQNNAAPDNSGGGILCRSDDTLIENCLIADNYAANSGGGAYCYNCNPTFTCCRFENNSTDFHGAGLFAHNCSPALQSCDFQQNQAFYAGGAIGFTQSNPLLKKCTLNANVAQTNTGGAIFASQDTNLTLRNCLLTGNHAPLSNAGAVFSYQSQLNIYNSTFVANRASGGAGGCLDAWQSQINLTNSILYAHQASSFPQIFLDNDSVLNISYTNFPGGPPTFLGGGAIHWGPGNIDLPPDFACPGAWNDNNTPADPTDDTWTSGVYDLNQNSPCINAGDPAYAPSPGETDLYGLARIHDNIIDLGACEFGAAPPDDEPQDPIEEILPTDIMTITKVKVKAGKSRQNAKDSLTVSGGLFENPHDANINRFINAERITIILATAQNPDFLSENIVIDPEKMKNGKYTYKRPKEQPGNIDQIKLDFNKNTFTLSAKNKNLTGLSSPFNLYICFGDYCGFAEIAEDKINAFKPLPMFLLMQYADAWHIEKCSCKFHTPSAKELQNPDAPIRKKGALSLSGTIALQEYIDMDHPAFSLTFISNLFSFTLDPGSDAFTQKPGKKVYNVKNYPLEPDILVFKNQNDQTGKLLNFGPVLNAAFDLEKGTFNIKLKYLPLEPFEVNPGAPFNFNLILQRCTGTLPDFNQTDTFIYPGE